MSFTMFFIYIGFFWWPVLLCRKILERLCNFYCFVNNYNCIIIISQICQIPSLFVTLSGGRVQSPSPVSVLDTALCLGLRGEAFSVNLPTCKQKMCLASLKSPGKMIRPFFASSVSTPLMHITTGHCVHKCFLLLFQRKITFTSTSV